MPVSRGAGCQVLILKQGFNAWILFPFTKTAELTHKVTGPVTEQFKGQNNCDERRDTQVMETVSCSLKRITELPLKSAA